MFCRRKKAPIQIKTNQSSWPSYNYSRNVIQKCVSNEVSNLFIASLTAAFGSFYATINKSFHCDSGDGAEWSVYAKMMSSQIRLLTDGLFSLLRAQRCQLLLVWRSFIWDKEVRLLVIQPSSYRNICKGSTGDISCSWGKGVSKLKNVICTSQVSPLLSVSLCAEQRRQKKKLALTEDCWTVLKFNEWSQKWIKYLASYIIFLSISSPFNFLWLGLPL